MAYTYDPANPQGFQDLVASWEGDTTKAFDWGKANNYSPDAMADMYSNGGRSISGSEAATMMGIDPNMSDRPITTVNSNSEDTTGYGTDPATGKWGPISGFVSTPATAPVNTGGILNTMPVNSNSANTAGYGTDPATGRWGLISGFVGASAPAPVVNVGGANGLVPDKVSEYTPTPVDYSVKSVFSTAANQQDGYSNNLDALYRTVLGREPDAAGKEWWMAQLNNPNSGVTEHTIRQAFIDGAQKELNPTPRTPTTPTTPYDDAIPFETIQPYDLSTVQGQMQSLLNSGSPYIQAARERGTRSLQARGLLNSTMAGQAGEQAAIETALPIAQQDAQAITTSELSAQEFAQDTDLMGTQYGYDAALSGQGYQQNLGLAAQNYGFDSQLSAQAYQQSRGTINLQADRSAELTTLEGDQTMARLVYSTVAATETQRAQIVANAALSAQESAAALERLTYTTLANLETQRIDIKANAELSAQQQLDTLAQLKQTEDAYKVRQAIENEFDAAMKVADLSSAELQTFAAYVATAGDSYMQQVMKVQADASITAEGAKSALINGTKNADGTVKSLGLTDIFRSTVANQADVYGFDDFEWSWEV